MGAGSARTRSGGSPSTIGGNGRPAPRLCIGGLRRRCRKAAAANERREFGGCRGDRIAARSRLYPKKEPIRLPERSRAVVIELLPCDLRDEAIGLAAKDLLDGRPFVGCPDVETPSSACDNPSALGIATDAVAGSVDDVSHPFCGALRRPRACPLGNAVLRLASPICLSITRRFT
jgi:hypothetical protein